MLLAHIDLLVAEHADRVALRAEGWEDAARGYAGSEPLSAVGVVPIGVGLVSSRRGRRPWTT